MAAVYTVDQIRVLVDNKWEVKITLNDVYNRREEVFGSYTIKGTIRQINGNLFKFKEPLALLSAYFKIEGIIGIEIVDEKYRNMWNLCTHSPLETMWAVR